jgi:hypothetical protein
MGRGILKLVVLGAVCSLTLFMAVVGQTSAATEKSYGSASVAIAAKPPKQPLVQGQTSSIHQAKKSSIPTVTANQPEPSQKLVKPVAVEPKLRSPKGLLSTSAQRQAEAVHKQAQNIAPEPKPVSQKIPQPTATMRLSEAIQKQTKPASSAIKVTSPKSTLPVGTEPQSKDIQTQAKPVQAELTLARKKSPRQIEVRKMEVPKAVVQPSTELMYHGILESPQRYDPRRIHHIGAGAPDPHNPELTQDHFKELDRNQDGSIDPVERVFGRLDMDRDLHDRRPR